MVWLPADESSAVIDLPQALEHERMIGRASELLDQDRLGVFVQATGSEENRPRRARPQAFGRHGCDARRGGRRFEVFDRRDLVNLFFVVVEPTFRHREAGQRRIGPERIVLNFERLALQERALRIPSSWPARHRPLPSRRTAAGHPGRSPRFGTGKSRGACRARTRGFQLVVADSAGRDVLEHGQRLGVLGSISSTS